MTKIVKIEEATFRIDESKYGLSFDGILITLDDNTEIKLGIYNGQNCCENWGYFTSLDDLSEFIGAEFISVGVVDKCLNVTKMEEHYFSSETHTMFVNIDTNKGLLQFTAYNSHNGYYGHQAVVVRNDAIIEDTYL
jgi:hypothetical protein